jgi:hypothetical protein
MGLPPKTANVRLACEVFGKKTELDKRPNAFGEQGIDKIINVLPVKDQGLTLTTTNEHVVVQEAVKTKISDSTVLRNYLEMFPPSSPKTLIRSPCSRAKVPVMPQWRAGSNYGKFNLLRGINN